MQIIKVPGINGLGKTQGCRNAGNAILDALYDIHSNEKGKIIDKKLLDLEEIHVNNENLEEQQDLIYKNAFEAFETQDKSIFLGGDHSISFPVCKAFFDFSKKKGDDACLIVFDAHVDCMLTMKEPTHEEWLRALVEAGFPVSNILVVGVRNMWQDEIRFLSKKGIRYVSINQLNENLQEVTDAIMEFAQGKQLYVSIDIDILDPAFAPATGHAETGGLTSREFIYIIQRISLLKNLRAVDIVEINVEKDKNHDNRTIKLGAKILAELL